MSTFEESLAIGKKGEAAFLRYLAARSDTSHISDVRLDPRFQRQEIDFVWYQLPGYTAVSLIEEESVLERRVRELTLDEDLVDERMRRCTYEVKTAQKFYEEQKLFFETVSNCNTNSPGWLHHTTADQIVYYVPEGDNEFAAAPERFYFLPLSFLREFILGQKIPFKEIKASTHNAEGTVLYQTRGFLVPAYVLEKYKQEGVQIVKDPFKKSPTWMDLIPF